MGSRPFLHQMLNSVTTPEQVRQGTFSWYKVDLGRIVSDLPSEELRAEARLRIDELKESVAEHIASAYTLEVEYWRVQTIDLHRAVEKGEYIFAEHAPGDSDKVKAPRNKAAMERMLAGRLEGQNLIWRSMSGRPRDGAPINSDAFVYLRRELFPDSFTLLDELLSNRRIAANVIRRRLGVPDLPEEPWPTAK